VAVIKVGTATEIELKEKKARVEDALQATGRASKRCHPRRLRGPAARVVERGGVVSRR